MPQRFRTRLITVAYIAINAFTSAIAEPAIASTKAPLFYSVPPKGKQIALDEAVALDLVEEHIHNADQIAARMFPEISDSATGWLGTIMLHFSGSTASTLKADSNDFRSEAATAFVEIVLLNGGIENSVSDAEYKMQQKTTASMFTLENGVTAAQYRKQLQNMLETLHEAARVAIAGYKIKWGISPKEALQH